MYASLPCNVIDYSGATRPDLKTVSELLPIMPGNTYVGLISVAGRLLSRLRDLILVPCPDPMLEFDSFCMYLFSVPLCNTHTRSLTLSLSHTHTMPGLCGRYLHAVSTCGTSTQGNARHFGKALALWVRTWVHLQRGAARSAAISVRVV